MTDLAYGVAIALYLVAGLLGWITRRDRRYARSLLALLSLGALAQAAGFVDLHLQDPPIPLESFSAALALIAWLTVVAYLLSLGARRFRGMAMWVGGGAALITAAAELGLRLAEPIRGAAPPAGAWPHAHVLLSAAGFSLLGLASLAGIAYLTKEGELKRKSGPQIALPSLESLDRVEHLTLVIGFPLLTLGVVTGFVWGLDRGLGPWSGHAFWTLGAWAVYLVPIGMRVVRRQHGPRPARGVVVSFAVLAFAYIGVRLLGGII
ncbi:MAG: cytochrome c biogenesis protein CcsA [Myxococcota bacterium]